MEFGSVTCDAGGINVGKNRLAWDAVDSIERVGDKLEIKRAGKKKPWARCPLNEVINLHVLMGVAAAARAPGPAV